MRGPWCELSRRGNLASLHPTARDSADSAPRHVVVSQFQKELTDSHGLLGTACSTPMGCTGHHASSLAVAAASVDWLPARDAGQRLPPAPRPARLRAARSVLAQSATGAPSTRFWGGRQRLLHILRQGATLRVIRTTRTKGAAAVVHASSTAALAGARVCSRSTGRRRPARVRASGRGCPAQNNCQRARGGRLLTPTQLHRPGNMIYLTVRADCSRVKS